VVQFRAAPPGTPFSVNKQSVAILLVEQNAKVALKLADYGYVLETGKIVIEGDGATLRQDESIVKAYLGGGH
jgi:branched-chain amino acid transport system ATP-binding protein